MLINLRNALMTGKRLPYDAEVEYLESTGTQWIDTGLVPKLTDTTSITYMRKARSAAVFGSCNSVWDGGYSIYESQLKFTNEGYFNSLLGTTDLTVQVTINGYDLYIDGTLKHSFSATGGTPNHRMVLCGLNLFSNRVSYLSSIRLYGFFVERDGVRVRDFIPVRFTNELGQSEGATYDRANPTVGMNRDGTPRNDGLYLNRGTGAFLYGADK